MRTCGCGRRVERVRACGRWGQGRRWEAERAQRCEVFVSWAVAVVAAQLRGVSGPCAKGLEEGAAGRVHAEEEGVAAVGRFLCWLFLQPWSSDAISFEIIMAFKWEHEENWPCNRICM
ncbi:unnamed protein product [Caretta caretta]